MGPGFVIAILLLAACASCGGSGNGEEPVPAAPTPTLMPTSVDLPTPTPTPTQVVLAAARAWAVGLAPGSDLLPQLQVVLRSDDDGETWEVIRRSSRRLGAIAFHDRHRGLLASDGGVVLRTDNGGDTWLVAQPVADDADVVFNDAAFADAQSAAVVGAVLDPQRGTTVRPVLTRTTDAGATWAEASIVASGQVALATMRLTHVCFSGAGIGLAVGFGEVAPGTFEVGASALVVLITGHDGSVWTDVTGRLGLGEPTAAFVSAIACNRDGTLWLVGRHAPRLFQHADPLQLVSHDDGATWVEGPFDSEFPPGERFLLGDIGFTEGGRAGWALSAPTSSAEPLRLFHTTNGGTSWRQQQRPLIASGGIPGARLAVADSARVIVAGDAKLFTITERTFRPFVWYTRDGGRTPWLAGTVPDDVLSLQDVTVATDPP
jgi:photosystem II stability/assembly factor-like uncharacterized protein